MSCLELPTTHPIITGVLGAPHGLGCLSMDRVELKRILTEPSKQTVNKIGVISEAHHLPPASAWEPSVTGHRLACDCASLRDGLVARRRFAGDPGSATAVLPVVSEGGIAALEPLVAPWRVARRASAPEFFCERPGPRLPRLLRLDSDIGDRVP